MIDAQNIKKSYKNGAVEVLKGVSLQIDSGKFAVITGASGSGKSTLMSVLSGLERCDSGKIFYGGENIAEMPEKQLTAFRRRVTGFIFQQYYLLPHLSVDKNVRLGADLAANKDYREIIQRVGLADKINCRPSELSAGNNSAYA